MRSSPPLSRASPCSAKRIWRKGRDTEGNPFAADNPDSRSLSDCSGNPRCASCRALYWQRTAAVGSAPLINRSLMPVLLLARGYLRRPVSIGGRRYRYRTESGRYFGSIVSNAARRGDDCVRFWLLRASGKFSEDIFAVRPRPRSVCLTRRPAAPRLCPGTPAAPSLRFSSAPLIGSLLGA